MGKSNSNDSVEPIENEWTNYMEWTRTDYKNLKKDEKYRLIYESYEFDLIFCYYSYRGKYGYCENCDAILKDKQNKTWVYHTADDTFEYYKFISITEYKSKMRDKYNEKVLNIVLKQLINDDFKW